MTTKLFFLKDYTTLIMMHDNAKGIRWLYKDNIVLRDLELVAIDY